ncbi:hypothetical protein K438DRAFT_1825497 [Mycena galopus ATCC 62051]|nr:hypothetical protein K438DRAFT_1825497 [Mycena galopus ATCC 62051]
MMILGCTISSLGIVVMCVLKAALDSLADITRPHSATTISEVITGAPSGDSVHRFLRCRTMTRKETFSWRFLQRPRLGPELCRFFRRRFTSGHWVISQTLGSCQWVHRLGVAPCRPRVGFLGCWVLFLK